MLVRCNLSESASVAVSNFVYALSPPAPSVNFQLWDADDVANVPLCSA